MEILKIISDIFSGLSIVTTIALIIGIVIPVFVNFIILIHTLLKWKEKINLNIKKYLLTKKKEEILGDLYEMREILEMEGHTQSQIDRIIFRETLTILFFQYWIQAKEWVSERFKISS